MAALTVVLDACIAITFGNADALDVVADLRSHSVVIAHRAAGEVSRPPASRELARHMASGTIEKVSIDPSVPVEQVALVRFDSSPRFRARGDAEVLALAAARGWIVGSDEQALRRVAMQEFGIARVAGTLDFLQWAVREKRSTVEEAVQLLERLDVGPILLRRITAAGTTPQAILRAG